MGTHLSGKKSIHQESTNNKKLKTKYQDAWFTLYMGYAMISCVIHIVFMCILNCTYVYGISVRGPLRVSRTVFNTIVYTISSYTKHITLVVRIT